MTVSVRGKHTQITIPQKNPDTGLRYKPGEKFSYTAPSEMEKVISSTLHSIPGMETVQCKPVIWATASIAYFRGNFLNDQSEQTSMAYAVGGLLKTAQEELQDKTIDVGCNAVLGMTVNITSDSSGERGNSKIVIVTICGTPCSIMPMLTLPTVNVEAAVVPLYASAMYHEASVLYQEASVLYQE